MKKYFVPIILAVMAAASCQEKPVERPEPADVRIEPVITRATEVNFEQGDRIGLKITKADGNVYAQNALLTYDGSAFAGDLKWYGDGGEACGLQAFYPFAEGGFPSSFAVGTDQRGGAGQYDLMLATKSGVKPQEAPVAMVFRHQLSQVVMKVENASSVAIESVTFKGLLPVEDFSFDENGEVVATPDESAAKIDIIAEAVTAGTKYRAIVVPQTTSFGVSVKTATGGSVVQKFAEVTMKPGYTYTIEAKVTAEGIAFSLSGEIQAWEDGGTLDPIDNPEDDDPDDDNPGDEQGDGYFVYGGLRYNTVKLPDGKTWMAEPLAYVPAGMSVSDDPAEGQIWYPYSSDGTDITVLRDAESVKKFGYLYSYDVLLGTTLDEENYDKFEGTRGICPEGWHIPTRAEWFALCGSSNASKYLGESGTQTNSDACFWDQGLQYAPVEKFDEAGFNFTLSGCVSNSKYNALIIDSSVCSVEKYYGYNRMAYIATSSPNSPTNYFALMTTFTSANNRGKVSLAFATLGKVGVQVRCVKD